MTADKTAPESEPETAPTPEPVVEPAPAMGDAPRVASRVETPALRANFSAIASAETDELESMGSAIGLARVAGDASVRASYVGLITAKQGGTFQQGYASAAIFGGDTTIHQAGAPIIAGKNMHIEQGGGCVLVGSDVTVSHGFVGLVAAGKTTISDDSKVLIGTKAALIIAAAILGGFAIVAVVMVLGAKRVASWRPHFDVKGIDMPQLPPWAAEIREKVQAAIRKAA